MLKRRNLFSMSSLFKWLSVLSFRCLTPKKNFRYSSGLVGHPRLLASACAKRKLSDVVFWGWYYRMPTTSRSWSAVCWWWNNQASSAWLSSRWKSWCIGPWFCNGVWWPMHCFPLSQYTFTRFITITKYHLRHFSLCLIQDYSFLFNWQQLASVDLLLFYMWKVSTIRSLH